MSVSLRGRSVGQDVAAGGEGVLGIAGDGDGGGRRRKERRSQHKPRVSCERNQVRLFHFTHKSAVTTDYISHMIGGLVPRFGNSRVLRSSPRPINVQTTFN